MARPAVSTACFRRCAKTRMPACGGTRIRPFGATRIWAHLCYNYRRMGKELIYPEECYAIRGAIYAVHNEMGNGFKEEVYQQCLEREFAYRNIPFDAKKELRICYKGVPIEKTYIPDFFCFEKIIVEIKAVSELTNEHRSQLMNYLRLTNTRMGLLVNFASYPKAVVEQWAR